MSSLIRQLQPDQSDRGCLPVKDQVTVLLVKARLSVKFLLSVAEVTWEPRKYWRKVRKDRWEPMGRYNCFQARMARSGRYNCFQAQKARSGLIPVPTQRKERLLSLKSSTLSIL